MSAAADDVIRSRELTTEETEEWRRRSRAMELTLKERLKGELEASKTAEARVTETWRKVIRLAKTTSLREEVSSASINFDRDVERADAGIGLAVSSLTEAEAQRSQALANHLRGIDSLIALNEAGMGDLELEFSREIRALQVEFSVEREALVARHAAFRAEVLHTLEAVKEVEDARLEEEQGEFEQAREALRRRALERLNALQSEMDTRIGRLEGAFEAAHLAYLAATGTRTQDFKTLTERTEYDALMSERQRKAMGRMERLLVVWRSRVINARRELSERNEGLASESTSMSKQVESMKGEILRKRRVHLGRLKALSAAAALVKSRLAEATALGEKILGLAEAARVHETLSEKVDPFAMSKGGGGGGMGGGLGAPKGTPSATLIAEARLEAVAEEEALLRGEEGGFTGLLGGGSDVLLAADGDGSSTSAPPSHTTPAPPTSAAARVATLLGLPLQALAPGTSTYLEESGAMETFYSRYNKALLEGLVLARRRDRLKAENEELQGAVQQVLDGMDLTPSAVDGPNALLVVNGRVAVDAGAGTALAPSRASMANSFTATGPPNFPVRLGGPSIVPVRPGAPGVATVVVSANEVFMQQRTAGATVGGYRR